MPPLGTATADTPALGTANLDVRRPETRLLAVLPLGNAGAPALGAANLDARRPGNRLPRPLGPNVFKSAAMATTHARKEREIYAEVRRCAPGQNNHATSATHRETTRGIYFGCAGLVCAGLLRQLSAGKYIFVLFL